MRERFVPITQEAIQVLEARRSRTPESEFVFGDRPTIVLNRVTRQLREVGSKTGTGLVSIQVLRHTFFELLMGAGAPPAVLIAIGGWRSPYQFMKSFISPADLYKCAAHYQMLVEEQL
jgi:integrase